MNSKNIISIFILSSAFFSATVLSNQHTSLSNQNINTPHKIINSAGANVGIGDNLEILLIMSNLAKYCYFINDYNTTKNVDNSLTNTEQNFLLNIKQDYYKKADSAGQSAWVNAIWNANANIFSNLYTATDNKLIDVTVPTTYFFNSKIALANVPMPLLSASITTNSLLPLFMQDLNKIFSQTDFVKNLMTSFFANSFTVSKDIDWNSDLTNWNRLFSNTNLLSVMQNNAALMQTKNNPAYKQTNNDLEVKQIDSDLDNGNLHFLNQSLAYAELPLFINQEINDSKTAGIDQIDQWLMINNYFGLILENKFFEKHFWHQKNDDNISYGEFFSELFNFGGNSFHDFALNILEQNKNDHGYDSYMNNQIFSQGIQTVTTYLNDPSLPFTTVNFWINAAINDIHTYFWQQKLQIKMLVDLLNQHAKQIIISKDEINEIYQPFENNIWNLPTAFDSKNPRMMNEIFKHNPAYINPDVLTKMNNIIKKLKTELVNNKINDIWSTNINAQVTAGQIVGIAVAVIFGLIIFFFIGFWFSRYRLNKQS